MPVRLADLLAAGAHCDRSGEMWRSMLEFHANNPHVYRRLREMCEELRRNGHKFYSMRTLVCVIRYEADVAGASTGQEVMIAGAPRTVTLNDHHSPYYARMLIEDDPTYAHFFELRAAEGDPVGPEEDDPMPPGSGVPMGFEDDDPDLRAEYDATS